MREDVVITGADESDIPVLCGLLGELFSMESDFAVDPKKQAQGLALLIGRPDTCGVFVARTGSRPVGMVTVQLNVSTAEGGYSGLLEDMVVTRDWRGKGIGKKLVHRAREWCLEKNATRLQLLADMTNTPALDFYKALGFAETKMVCRRVFLA